VRVRPTTSRPGCDAAGQYTVHQYTGRYPLVLGPRRRAQLSRLAGDSALWPRIAMRDLAVNQDVCKGAVVRLDYTGLATR